MLSLEQYQRLAEAAQKDPRPLMEQALWIQTKMLEGQLPLQRLIFNRAQQKLHSALMAQREAGLACRAIVLKARQPGISSLGCGYATAMAMAVPHSNSMVITHVDDASIEMFTKVDLMVRRIPSDMRPIVGVDRRDQIGLEGVRCSDGFFSLGSKVKVATAGGKEPWRSQTLQLVWLSEFAKYVYPEETLLGVMQSVPDSPATMVVIESTARGIGNMFHDEWLRAEARKSDFVPVFIGWWEVPEYMKPVPPDFQLDEDEHELKRALGLANEQIQWRRYAIHSKCQGDVGRFDQEYPATPESAFMASGRPAFPREILNEMAGRARGVFVEKGDISKDHGFSPSSSGMLLMYRRPEPDHDYTLGADPASGVAEADYTCGQVFDRDRMEIVATLHGYIPPVPFANMLFALGRWYNDAVLAPELTGGFGFSVIEELKMLQYPRLYVWQRVDRIRGQISNYFGWETSYRTRQLLIDTSAHLLNERSVMIWDLPTVQEFIEFEYTDGRAEGRRFDDRVMAALIAMRIHIEWPLKSTGLPPRMLLDQPAQVLDENPNAEVLNNAETQVWQAIDSEVARLINPNGQNLHDEYLLPPSGPGRVPDIPW